MRCPAAPRGSGLPPLLGAGRVEDTLNLLGQALRQAVGRAAQEWGTTAEAIVEDAGLELVGQSSLNAALDLDWGKPRARDKALCLVLEAVDRWQQGLEQQPSLSAHAPPMQEVLDTIAQVGTQDTAPDPEGGPGGRRIKQHGAPDRRIALEDQDRRHGRTSSAQTFQGFKEHVVLDLDSQATRAVVVRPAHEPASAVVERVAEDLESGPGLLQLAIALGDMASPRMAQWAAQGVCIMARPWPQGGVLCTKADVTLDCAHGAVPCPNGHSVPMVPGKPAQLPASACDACPMRTQCPTARMGHGRSLTSREDAQCQQKLRAKSNTKRGRASLRTRTAVEHASSHPLAHQGRRARYKGLRKNQFAGRRQAAVSNLQVAAHDAEERRLAS
jgi:Transposase DDE domain